MRTYSDNGRRTYTVPGNGLCVEVIVTSEEITIIPATFGCEEKNSEFFATRTQSVYRFAPEAYKRFWKALVSSDEAAYKLHPERMRAALNYALNIYRRKYGEIFN